MTFNNRRLQKYYKAPIQVYELHKEGYELIQTTPSHLFIIDKQKRVASVPQYLYDFFIRRKLEWKRYYGAYRFANDYDDTTDGKYLLRYYPTVTPKCLRILEGNPFVQVSSEYEFEPYVEGDGGIWRVKN